MNHSAQDSAGHRDRMRQKFIAQGARPFLAHEILEMLLFSATPYKDTNPLAHRLEDRFGNLAGVFSASVEDLMTVSGMGLHSAAFIRLVRETAMRGMYEPVPKSVRFCDYRSLGEYLLQEENSAQHSPEVKVLLFNNRYNLLGTVGLEANSVSSPSFSLNTLARVALQYNASMVVLVSNHAGRSAFPTAEEIDVTADMQVSLKMLGITLLEHYILSGSHYIGVSRKLVNGFEDRPDIRLFFRTAPESRKMKG